MTSPDSESPAAAPTAVPPTVDVQAPALADASQFTQAYPVRQPEEESKDFQVIVRASVLRRCRTRLGAVAAKRRFPLPEVLLGTSTLSAGAALSAIASGVPLDSWQGVLFFVFSPMVFVGSGVAFIILHGSASLSTQHLAEDVLRDIPDPDHSIDVRNK